MKFQKFLYLDKWTITHFLLDCVIALFLSFFLQNKAIILFSGIIILIVWEIFENLIMVKYIRKKILFLRTTSESKKDMVSDLIIGIIAIIFIIVLLTQ